jgi:hypothetical protein
METGETRGNQRVTVKKKETEREKREGWRKRREEAERPSQRDRKTEIQTEVERTMETERVTLLLSLPGPSCSLPNDLKL